MMTISRRRLLAASATMSLWPRIAGAQGRGEPFSWAALQARAQRLARSPYRAVAPVPGAERIDFDAVGALRYRPDRTLAGGIRLFPVGNTTPAPVSISLVENGRARPVAFTPDLFERRPGADTAPDALGIAGFRVMEPGRDSDWLSFLGASYFRAAGSQDQYGLSARGIAIDTGIDGREEFPAFTHFWIERGGERAYTIYALLDGPSVTGAYRFVCTHPKGVEQEVSAVLFLRRDVARLGIAPATSMFWYDQSKPAGDWRPEIHDSDGLALLTVQGERVWRPLVNPPRATIDSFGAGDVRGFGLIQRDRRFASYQDDGAFYDRRPNLWVEPRGRWGQGAVMLYAFPTSSETLDNVVAFWTPAQVPRAGQRMQFDYRLSWGSDDPTATAGARVVDSWVGAAGRPGAPPTAGARKLVVDYEGAGLGGLDRNSGVSAEVSVTRGRILQQAAYPVVGQRDRWRVTLDVAPEAGATADVRLFLRRGDQALGETLLAPIVA